MESDIEPPPPVPLSEVQLEALIDGLHSFDATFMFSYRPSTGETVIEVDVEGNPIAVEDFDPLVIPVEFVGSRSGYRDREDFVALLGDGPLAERLTKALGGRRPYRDFGDALDHSSTHPDVLGEWMAFDRARRTRRAIAWLRNYELISEAELDEAFETYADPDVTPRR